jgi:mono/diheme cytochrome c family protein
MGRILIGIVLGVGRAPLAMLAWFCRGHPPVAVADPPLPFERQITRVPLDARIDCEKPAWPLTAPDEKNFVAGALIYRDQCAACHGFLGEPPSFASHMYPKAPPLWEKHRSGEVVGLSDDPPGETYWKIGNGIRLSGMPAFRAELTPAEIWQVAQLLANADKPLPPDVLEIVRSGQPPATAQASSAEGNAKVDDSSLN